MFSALVAGKMAKPPRVGQSKNGKAYCAVSIRAPVAPGEGGEAESVFVSGLAFGADAEALGRLGPGDSVAVTGNAKLQSWESPEGKTYLGLNLMVTGVLSAYQLRQKRGDSGAKQKQSKPRGGPSSWDVYADPEPFNDDLGF